MGHILEHSYSMSDFGVIGPIYRRISARYTVRLLAMKLLLTYYHLQATCLVFCQIYCRDFFSSSVATSLRNVYSVTDDNFVINPVVSQCLYVCTFVRGDGRKGHHVVS